MAKATEARKKSHLGICQKGEVEYRKEAGFSDVELLHHGLPDFSLEAVDTGCVFLKKQLAAPFIIEAMTGGCPEAASINRKLAAAAEKAGIAFSLGSQRAMFENERLTKTYYVRDVAPNIPIIGNIGVAQLKQIELKQLDSGLRAVKADALAIHLNSLQEAIQGEGDADFNGALSLIEKASKALSLPVIVKETGAGISPKLIASLESAGVKMANVAGAGGTSWSRVEYLRSRNSPAGFEEWGIPTVDSIALCHGHIPCLASGGIRSGLDAAKAIALGAELAGAALPFLRAKDPAALVGQWKAQLRLAMFLTNSRNLSELRKAPLLITGKTAERLRLMGIEIAFYAQR